jgi:glycosyltransferase involved in cell wall biosynthesis
MLTDETITVLIPTRERANTLEHSLSTCVKQNDGNLRILVSDNASQDNTKTVVEAFKADDGRVEYINPGVRLGMPEHWEFALAHVREGFVIVLGDDDALFPDALKTAREVLKTAPETRAISWPYSFYGYPSLFTPSKNHLGLAFGELSGVRNSVEWLAKLAAFEALYFELAMVYHGLVHTSVLNEIRCRSGRVIAALNPDIYLCIAVTASIESYYRLSRPLSLCGTSHHSTGASGITLDEGSPVVRAFWKETRLTTHPLVPYLPCMPTIVLETLLRARDAGFLPDNLPIAYERCVSRAFIELYAANHSERVFNDYLGRLEELCRRIDQTAHLELLKGYDSTARKALEDELGTTPWSPRHQIVANLANTTIKDVSAAVDLAALISRDDVLREIFIESTREIREVRTAFDNRFSQLRELDALARGRQNELEKRHLEFTERIASLGQQLAETHAESTARFHQIEKLTELLKISEKDRADRQEQIDHLTALLATTNQTQGDERNRASVASAPQQG